MKRANHIFEKLIQPETLYKAFRLCSDGKQHYKAVKKFSENLKENIRELQTELENGTYTTGEYRIKQINEHGKDRKIHILPYKDRVLQRALGIVLDEHVYRTLTANTHASLEGRGIHTALNQIKKYLENDPDNTQYCLKIDIRHYFESIDHEILKTTWRRIIKDRRILRIIDDIIDSVPPDEGIPIGNHFSQLSATLYLSQFDHWIKEGLKIPYYTRYQDDMVFFAADSKQLRKWFREIDWYLISRLNLSIKPNWQIFFVDKRPVDIVGYRIRHDNTILRKSTFKRMRRRFLEIVKIEDAADMTYSQYCSANSFKGWSMHGNDKTIREKYIEPAEAILEEYHKRYLTHPQT